MSLQELIAAASDLSPREQIELIQAVSQSLEHRTGMLMGNVWQRHTLQDVLAEQPGSPVIHLEALKADFWPEDESADEIINYIYQQRREDRLRDQ
jgi:hypothetical protein